MRTRISSESINTNQRSWLGEFQSREGLASKLTLGQLTFPLLTVSEEDRVLALTPVQPSQYSVRMIFDMALGAIVMGTVGTLIGFLTSPGTLPVAASIGIVLGVC